MYRTHTVALDSTFYNPTSSDSTKVFNKPYHTLTGDTITTFTMKPYHSKVIVMDDTVSSTIAVTGATEYTKTTASVAGTVKPYSAASTTVHFLYGKVPGVYTDSAAATESPLTGWTIQAVTASLTGLDANTTYYINIATHNSDAYTRGTETSFTTSNYDYFYTFSYVGDGNDDRTIACPLTPDVVIIKSASAGSAVFRTSAMTGDTTMYFTVYSGGKNNYIQALGSNSFQVGTDTLVNKSGTTYYATVIKAATGFCKVGYYWGTGLGHSETGMGSNKFYLVRENGSDGTARMRYSTYGSDTTSYVTTSAVVANNITTIDADGITIGTDNAINKVSKRYYYVAIDTVLGYCWQDKYLGDEAATHEVNATTAQPNFVIFNATDEVSQRVFRTSAEAENSCLPFSALIEYSDATYVKTLDADGWTVGSNAVANISGKFVHFLAIKAW
jgi:hypothetical protein